ncbi:MAG TPA: hypothetical protein VHA37_07030 [Candidatus Saccharimonadales bacterium]|nr:hypothetical protein [Candidatus Saccharimonadales bacterium]
MVTASALPGQRNGVHMASDSENAAHVQAMEDARSLARTGNVTGVEQAIGRSITAPSGSAEWHTETARGLAEVARLMARENRPAAVGPLITRAIDHLHQTLAAASDVRTLSRAHANIGYLDEQFVGDVPAAIASYQAAILADPKNKQAREALARLQMMDANLRVKLKANAR